MKVVYTLLKFQPTIQFSNQKANKISCGCQIQLVKSLGNPVYAVIVVVCMLLTQPITISIIKAAYRLLNFIHLTNTL